MTMSNSLLHKLSCIAFFVSILSFCIPFDSVSSSFSFAIKAQERLFRGGNMHDLDKFPMAGGFSPQGAATEDEIALLMQCLEEINSFVADDELKLTKILFTEEKVTVMASRQVVAGLNYVFKLSIDGVNKKRLIVKAFQPLGSEPTLQISNVIVE